MGERDFRTPESYEFEAKTRELLLGFFQERGFADVRDTRKRHGRNESQLISAKTPDGSKLTMRVRLCWRRGTSDSRGDRAYSAAQLLSQIKNGDWEGSLEDKVEREARNEVTHFLFVQREELEIVYAALVPLSLLIPIWCEQRDISARLIQQKRLGRRTKNHAMNGSSPTIYLQDDRASEVALALWRHPEVHDLAQLPRLTKIDSSYLENSPGDTAYLEGSVQEVLTNRYERDGKARRACIEWHGALCCICGFDFGARYGKLMEGYIHVHHLNPLASIGAEYEVDPIRDLRPVCPNCHAVLHRSSEIVSIEAVQSMLTIRLETATENPV